MSQISQHFQKSCLCDEDTKYQLNSYLEKHPNFKVSKISFNRQQGTCVEDLFVVFDVIEPKKEVYINIDKLSKLFAGHSDYHGDTILSLIGCMSEGKEVSSARPLDTDKIKLKAIKEYQEKLIYEIVNRPPEKTPDGAFYMNGRVDRQNEIIDIINELAGVYGEN